MVSLVDSCDGRGLSVDGATRGRGVTVDDTERGVVLADATGGEVFVDITEGGVVVGVARQTVGGDIFHWPDACEVGRSLVQNVRFLCPRPWVGSCFSKLCFIDKNVRQRARLR